MIGYRRAGESGARRLRDVRASRPWSANMPLFYFHLRDGADVLLDPDGRELDQSAIAAAALAEARAMIAADVLEGRVRLDQQIEVLDSAGTVIHRLPFEDAVTVTHLAIRPH